MTRDGRAKAPVTKVSRYCTLNITLLILQSSFKTFNVCCHPQSQLVGWDPLRPLSISFQTLGSTHTLTGKDVKSPISRSSMQGGAVEICSLIATPFLKYLWLTSLDWSWRKKEFGVGQAVEPWRTLEVQITGPMTAYQSGWSSHSKASMQGGLSSEGLPLSSPWNQALNECTSQASSGSRAEGQGCGCLRQLCNTTGPASDSLHLSSC